MPLPKLYVVGSIPIARSSTHCSQSSHAVGFPRFMDRRRGQNSPDRAFDERAAAPQARRSDRLERN